MEERRPGVLRVRAWPLQPSLRFEPGVGDAGEVVGERGAESRVQEGVEKDKDSAKKAKEREALEEGEHEGGELEDKGHDRAEAVLMVFSDPTMEPIPVAQGKGACGAWPGEGAE